MPTLQPGRRPSTATITIAPSARWPMAVRGSRPWSCTGVNASPALKIGLPSRTSVGPALTASVTVAQFAGSGIRKVTCVPTGNVANGRAAVPRATITAPPAGTSVLTPDVTDTTVPTRSVRGAAGGNGSSVTVTPLLAGATSPPQTGVKSAAAFARGGSFSCDTGYQTLSGPCQRPAHGTLSVCSVALVSTPTAARPSADWCSTTPPCISNPLGQPPVQWKKSPLTPTVVICADASRSIAETVSRPMIVPFESSGISL